MKYQFVAFILAINFLNAGCGVRNSVMKGNGGPFSGGISLSSSSLCYLEISNGNKWHAEEIENRAELLKIVERFSGNADSLIIPVFPTVYSPGFGMETDYLYFDVLLNQAGIKKGDKVLVVGSGSGADVWVAWLKSGVKIYAIDINPIAVANTIATAQIGGFPVDARNGDILTYETNGDFSNFDFVLWNMPMITNKDSALYMETQLMHDGDDGNVLDGFLKKLKKMLRKGGRAVIWNSKEAKTRIDHYDRVFEENDAAVFIIDL